MAVTPHLHLNFVICFKGSDTVATANVGNWYLSRKDMTGTPSRYKYERVLVWKQIKLQTFLYYLICNSS